MVFTIWKNGYDTMQTVSKTMEEGFDIYPCRIYYDPGLKIDLGLKTFLVVIVGNGISRYEYIDITRTKIID